MNSVFMEFLKKGRKMLEVGVARWTVNIRWTEGSGT